MFAVNGIEVLGVDSNPAFLDELLGSGTLFRARSFDDPRRGEIPQDGAGNWGT
jgi:hypothetical protein